MLEKTNIAAKLLVSIGELFGSVRGGLGIGVVLVGMLLAASTGIVGATVVTMGMLALPTMIKAGYDEKIATGTICASGTLGQIIPPSIVLILLAEMLQGANEEAGLMTGDLAPVTSYSNRFICWSINSGFNFSCYVYYLYFNSCKIKTE